MFRCRQCNSELIEQARFCNVCGLPQDPQEPEIENSTRNGEKPLETNILSYCENCRAEIPNDARFCTICGTAQTARKSSAFEATSNQVIPTSTTINNGHFKCPITTFDVNKTSTNHKNGQSTRVKGSCKCIHSP